MKDSGPLLADDVIVGIFHYISQYLGEFSITSDREILHSAFYEIRKDYPLYFSQIQFHWNGFFHESVALDQAFSNLTATELIERRGLSGEKYFITKEIHKSFKSIEKIIDPVMFPFLAGMFMGILTKDNCDK